MSTFYWGLLCVLLIIIELATMGLTTLWFAAGSLAALLVNLAGGNIWIQTGAFIGVSFILLFCTRPLAAKYLNSRIEKTNVDSLIGKLATVTEDIDNTKDTGQVSVNGQVWTARSEDGKELLTQGQQVEILYISGVKLIVRKFVKYPLKE